MTSPRRRPVQRDDLDVETTLKRAVLVAPEIELGWSLLRRAMRDAGWPSRTPEGDRRPSTGNGEESPCIDYADSTGEMALRLDDLAGDLEALQDHWHLVATSLRAMATISRKHIQPGPLALPACSVTTCEGYVERTDNGGYRGCEQIAGMWVAKPGVRPLCAMHRQRIARAVPRVSPQ